MKKFTIALEDGSIEFIDAYDLAYDRTSVDLIGQDGNIVWSRHPNMIVSLESEDA